jgi:type IV pilus assembly protein PilC
VARFTRTMATLIASGVPILDCLEITAHTSGNAVVEEAILNVKHAIEEGRTIVEPLKESGVFPAMVTQMIGVGEQAGALEQMLTKIADFYEEEVDAAVGDLMTAMEPLMIVVLGTVVGGIVISMYLPIFTLVGQLSSGHK